MCAAERQLRFEFGGGHILAHHLVFATNLENGLVEPRITDELVIFRERQGTGMPLVAAAEWIQRHQMLEWARIALPTRLRLLYHNKLLRLIFCDE